MNMLGGRCIAFNDLASQFTWHHCCYILFIVRECKRLAHREGREIRLYLLLREMEHYLQPCLKPPYSSYLIRAAVRTTCDLAVKSGTVPGTDV